jgi:hypothetical protein
MPGFGNMIGMSEAGVAIQPMRILTGSACAEPHAAMNARPTQKLVTFPITRIRTLPIAVALALRGA